MNDGSGTYQSSIINNDNTLITIPITADNIGTSTQHPSKVTFNIKYNQVLQKHIPNNSHNYLQKE